ncbi:hypothetical protein NQ314_004707 [Rhamnusium bicolor]|uniref:Uncharacterized protein n=1 Tax=Rhamnusium bicolor TaxID=1586634 RepID=A0AAV8ZIC4_9CUCU|nr:hypothetical protein NQ314_004707 [Rhamnusium bicolor]
MPQLFKSDNMDNKAFKGTDTGTELTKVTVNGSSPSTARATTTCTPEVCRSARQRFQPPDLSSDSPWNKKKTYFFYRDYSDFCDLDSYLYYSK